MINLKNIILGKISHSQKTDTVEFSFYEVPRADRLIKNTNHNGDYQ